MKRVLTSVLLAGFALAAVTTASLAGPNANAKILIHLLPNHTKNPCFNGRPACHDVNTTGTLFPTMYYACLVVSDGNAAAGVAGLQCGIHYNGAPQAGVDVLTWTLCATLQFNTPTPGHIWPADGGGTVISWDSVNDCQRFEPGGMGTGVTANAGYFYMAAYTPDHLEVIPRPVDGLAKVWACDSEEDVIPTTTFPPPLFSHLGYANFTAGGTTTGWNPCGVIIEVIPVQPTTWSGIKANY